MKKSILLLVAAVLLSTGSVFAQSLDEIIDNFIENPIKDMVYTEKKNGNIQQKQIYGHLSDGAIILKIKKEIMKQRGSCYNFQYSDGYLSVEYDDKNGQKVRITLADVKPNFNNPKSAEFMYDVRTPRPLEGKLSNATKTKQTAIVKVEK